MCRYCDYPVMLGNSGLEPTPNRLNVLEVIGNNTCPLSAQEIHDILKRRDDINPVTVYRILNLLVEKGLVEQLSAGDQSRRYGLAPNPHHLPHAHFYCRQCRNMECLDPQSLEVDIKPLKKTFPGVIENTQVRIDGICKTCLKR